MTSEYQFPHLASWDEWKAIYNDFSIWEPAAKHLIAKAGLPIGLIASGDAGSNAIVRVAAKQPYFIKIFPPVSDDCDREAAVYEAIGEQDRIPKLLGSGKDGKWGWLALTEIDGHALHGTDAYSIDIFRSLGTVVLSLHQKTVSTASVLARQSWHDYVKLRQTQVDSVLQSEGNSDLAMEIMQLFSAYLSAMPEPVLTHSDLTQDHIFISNANDRLTGLIDFADCRLADPAYEFPALWLDGCNKDRRRFEAFVEGYGRGELFADRERMLLMIVLNPFIFRDEIMRVVRTGTETVSGLMDQFCMDA